MIGRSNRTITSTNASGSSNANEEDSIFELDISGFPSSSQFAQRVNGRYTFLKMSSRDNRPVFEHESSKAVMGCWSGRKCWIICRDERSFDRRYSGQAYGYIREDKIDPAGLTKNWSIRERDNKWVSMNQSLSITSWSRTEARGRLLDNYKPGRYQLKGHLPVYDSCGALEHSQMLERHCFINVVAIHANPEDNYNDLIYGQCEHGFVPLGEYHGKSFTTRVSD